MKGWRTIAFAVVISLIGIFSNDEVQIFVAANLPWLSPLVGAIVVGLRAITTSPIFKPDPE
jgi:hypothetical protein